MMPHGYYKSPKPGQAKHTRYSLQMVYQDIALHAKEFLAYFAGLSYTYGTYISETNFATPTYRKESMERLVIAARLPVA